MADELETKIEMAKGIFSKFRNCEFREHQVDAIKFIANSKKKVVVCCLPTGAGKSLIGAVTAELLGGGIYMVHSKPLQVQLNMDFPEIPILWGRSNYNCQRFEGFKCSDCTHSKTHPCTCKKNSCEYVVAKEKAISSKVKILNYEYWITETNYVGKFNDENLVVVDEADSLEKTIAKFISLDFTYSMMKMLGVAVPKYKTSISDKSINSWKGWAQDANEKVGRSIHTIEHAVACSNPDPDMLARMERLSGVKRKLDLFISHVDKSWVYEEKTYEGKTSISFKPRWVNEGLAQKYVWNHADKFVLMSATFPPLPVLAKELGVPLKDMEYREFPSTFPKENRPIVLHPVVNIRHSMEESELEPVVDAVKYLLEKHKNEKGLIHSVSYKLTNKIMEIGDPRLMTHNGGDKIESIENFKQSPEPLVMVSPSSERGISLDGDMCRWCVWLKAPYLSLGDKLVASRVYSGYIGNVWYRSDAMQTVVQGCGRLVRSKEDYGVVYILDHQIVKLIAENPMMAPMWWREAIL